MADLYLDPNGHFAVRSSPSAVELWTVVAIRFMHSERPAWQEAADGLVARLHMGLRAMRPTPGDVLACSFSHPSRAERPDVENRLFTNAKEPSRQVTPGAPRSNPFTHLPRRIRFERRFRTVEPPAPLRRTDIVHYRYALKREDAPWGDWAADPEALAEWDNVRVTGVSDQVAWPIWLSMREPTAEVGVRYEGEPLTDDFGISLTVHACRPLQVVTVMESVIDGIIASFQREPDRPRAERVSDCLRRKNAKLRAIARDRLVNAQTSAPAVFAGPPWNLNPAATWCQLSPADHLLVAGEMTVTPPTGRAEHALSGRVFGVTASASDQPM